MVTEDSKAKAARIAASQAALAQRYADDPDGVARFNARMAHLAAARKRERERFETRCLGNKQAAEPLPKKPNGMTRQEWKLEKARLRAAAAQPTTLVEKWSHKQGTPETHEHAAHTHQGALAQLLANGTLNAEQVEWAAQISNVHRSVVSGVEVAVASLEARVDQSSRGPAVAERIHRVRMHGAYTLWRSTLPAPKSLVLDMIVGDAVGYSVAAKRYRVHNRKAKRLLLEAISRWPICVVNVFGTVDARMVADMNEARVPHGVAPPRMPDRVEYAAARGIERGREATDEAYLLPMIDPAFFDDRGYFLPWEKIAAIIVGRAAAVVELEEAE
jgi:hypothetical protein